MIECPRPSSIGKYGGDRELDRRYSAGRREAGSCREIVRRQFVNVLMMRMRERVSDNVANVCDKNE